MRVIFLIFFVIFDGFCDEGSLSFYKEILSQRKAHEIHEVKNPFLAPQNTQSQGYSLMAIIGNKAKISAPGLKPDWYELGDEVGDLSLIKIKLGEVSLGGPGRIIRLSIRQKSQNVRIELK